MNVLLALAWPSHMHHAKSQQWFAGRGHAAFRTCPLTEAGFIRISANPQFSRIAVSVNEAAKLLLEIKRLPGHEFWPDDLPVAEVFTKWLIGGYRQVTDAYLLSLAKKRSGTVATLDRGLSELGAAHSLSAELLL